MFEVQFTDDGVSWYRLISFDNRDLAESVLKACAGWKLKPYWRINAV